jgi:hypothetical protein
VTPNPGVEGLTYRTSEWNYLEMGL